MQLHPVAHRDHLVAQLEVVVYVGKPGGRDHELISCIRWGHGRCDMRSASWMPITLSPVVTEFTAARLTRHEPGGRPGGRVCGSARRPVPPSVIPRVYVL